MKAREIVFSEVSEFLSYSSETGALTWRKNFHSSKIGKQAGAPDGQGYWHLKLNGRRYSCSRIAWCIHYGSIDQELQIDHIDRNPSNNKISNLRLTTASENCMNRQKKNESPKYCLKTRYGYKVRIEGKRMGLFKSAADAEQAVKGLTP